MCHMTAAFGRLQSADRYLDGQHCPLVPEVRWYPCRELLMEAGSSEAHRPSCGELKIVPPLVVSTTCACFRSEQHLRIQRGIARHKSIAHSSIEWRFENYAISIGVWAKVIAGAEVRSRWSPLAGAADFNNVEAMRLLLKRVSARPA
jgi:hypothetical protein